MDKVVHFEIPTDDLSRASEFYRSIFGWDLQDMSGQGMDYTIVMTVPVDDQQRPTQPGAINGGMMKRSGDTTSPVNDRGGLDRRRDEEDREQRRQHGPASPGDPRDGRLRLFHGQRGQHDGSVGDRSELSTCDGGER